MTNQISMKLQNHYTIRDIQLKNCKESNYHHILILILRYIELLLYYLEIVKCLYYFNLHILSIYILNQVNNCVMKMANDNIN